MLLHLGEDLVQQDANGIQIRPPIETAQEQYLTRHSFRAGRLKIGRIHTVFHNSHLLDAELFAHASGVLAAHCHRAIRGG